MIMASSALQGRSKAKQFFLASGAAALLFSINLALAESQPSLTRGRPPCSPFHFEGHAYTLCEAPLDRFAIRFFWQQSNGTPYTYLSALPKTDGNGGRLAFALNGGMFHPDYRPVGLYIEDGRELVQANTRSGPGNFHLKPNGIFYVGEGEAGVLETAGFLRQRPKALFATQSGPMLVIDGKLHPRIARANASAKHRDGVCVRGEGVVLFAISEGEVPFDTFERLFRDGLKCRNALFLDGGSAPALYIPSASRNGNSFLGLGPMIGVYEKGHQ
jgi:uncharacterized protein YigE (DUF2233 family)